jgi:outer membrane protein TolC
MSVLIFFQPNRSRASARLPRRIRRTVIACVALAALSCAGLSGLARAQQNASLPMAPSALRAALPVNSVDRVPGKPLADRAFTDNSFAGRVFAGNAAAGTSTVRFAVEQATPGALPLSLDDAIDRALKHNLQVQLATETQQSVHGQVLGVYFALLPNMRATTYTNTLELNLAAMGFKPSSLAAFGFPPGSVHEIVKVDTTSALFSANQVLFSLPDFYLYQAAKKASDVVAMNTLNVRGGVVDAVGTQYLAALADQAQIANAQALVTADVEVLRQATLAHDAGVGINLDVLRARVQLQSEQQSLLRAQNAFAKDKIALNRLIGLAAEQELSLTDAVPYADLAEMPLEQARAIAYQRRKDLLGLTAQLEVAQRAQKAVKYRRLPSLSFNGDYGVLGVTHGSYHGVFTAQGTLKIPIFEEGRFRGESEVAAAQQISLQRQIASLKITIDAQIRASRMDVESSAALVKVARSNVDLASQALADTRDRFAAGVADNLPVVEAQAALAAAQSRLVATEFRFNQSKLTLARNTGVVESQYNQYLGR